MRTPRIDFAAANYDALLVSSPANIEYLTGFNGSNGLLLVERDGEVTLFTDPRYTIAASQLFTDTGGSVVTVRNQPSLALPALKLAVRRKHRRIGFERLHTRYADYQVLAGALPLGVDLVPAGGEIEDQRMVKDEAEIARIRAAVVLNSAAFDAAIRKIRPGMTELALAGEIDYQQRRRGATGPAFDTIVAFGEKTALPHAHPGTARLGKDELILIDAGARLDGYTSDLTRMLALGRVSARLRQLYDAVLEAQLAGIDAIRPGVSARRVDEAARKALGKKDLSQYFVHSTGHGLGLEIHEAPGLRKKDQTRLEPGMVVTVEPGVYIEGVGGIRIEDTVLVTGTGHEILTPTPKELIQL